MRPVVKAIPKAASYQLRYIETQIENPPDDAWTIMAFRLARKVPIVTGLTPGTSYTFQVRALGGLDFNDWSDPVTRICT